MSVANVRFVAVSENVHIPVPVDCSAEEEQQLKARFLERNDLSKLEAECQQLSADIAADRWIGPAELDSALVQNSPAGKGSA